jgi:hypothetical protein
MNWPKQSFVLVVSGSLVLATAQAGRADEAEQPMGQPTAAAMQQSPEALDQIVAPIALYPDTLSRTSRNQKGDAAPRLCGQLWMIRRFTSARLFPQSAGAKQKNRSGSGHYGICRVAPRHFNRNGFFAESVKSQAIRD